MRHHKGSGGIPAKSCSILFWGNDGSENQDFLDFLFPLPFAAKASTREHSKEMSLDFGNGITDYL